MKVFDFEKRALHVQGFFYCQACGMQVRGTFTPFTEDFSGFLQSGTGIDQMRKQYE